MNLENIIYLSNEDYDTLVTTGTVTVNGVTLTYSDNNVYITPTEYPVTDVQVNGVSVLTNGVAIVPNYYYTGGGWSGLSYTLTGQGGASNITITLPTGTAATQVAAGNHTHNYAATNHTHATTIATSTGTSSITLSAGGKYAITAGGTTYTFTMPADTNNKVTQSYNTASGYFPVLFSSVAGTISTASRGDATACVNNSVYVHPIYGELCADSFAFGTMRVYNTVSTVGRDDIYDILEITVTPNPDEGDEAPVMALTNNNGPFTAYLWVSDEMETASVDITLPTVSGTLALQSEITNVEILDLRLAGIPSQS